MEIKGESFSKKRRIGYTQYTERGKIPTEKNKNDGYVEYESLGEATLILLHDHDPNCVEIESQPVQVPNRNKKGKPYTIDFGAKFKDGKRVLYDVKHHTFFERLKKSEERKKNWEDRKEIITNYCENHGFLYEIITDNELYTVRQENVEFFRKNKIEPEQLPIIKPKIIEMLEKQEITRIELAIELSKRLELDIKEIIPSIDHLIFHDYFLLDFETIIDDNTKLNLRFLRAAMRFLFNL